MKLPDLTPRPQTEKTQPEGETTASPAKTANLGLPVTIDPSPTASNETALAGLADLAAEPPSSEDNQMIWFEHLTRLRDESLVTGGRSHADRQLEAETIFFREDGWVATEIGRWTPTEIDEEQRRVLKDFPRRWWWKPRYRLAELERDGMARAEAVAQVRAEYEKGESS